MQRHQRFSHSARLVTAVGTTISLLTNNETRNDKWLGNRFFQVCKGLTFPFHLIFILVVAAAVAVGGSNDRSASRRHQGRRGPRPPPPSSQPPWAASSSSSSFLTMMRFSRLFRSSALSQDSTRSEGLLAVEHRRPWSRLLFLLIPLRSANSSHLVSTLCTTAADSSLSSSSSSTLDRPRRC